MSFGAAHFTALGTSASLLVTNAGCTDGARWRPVQVSALLAEAVAAGCPAGTTGKGSHS
jgi:hypothetical protein